MFKKHCPRNKETMFKKQNEVLEGDCLLLKSMKKQCSRNIVQETKKQCSRNKETCSRNKMKMTTFTLWRKKKLKTYKNGKKKKKKNWPVGCYS